MPAKKSKSKKSMNEAKTNENMWLLVRDLSTQVLRLVQRKSISINGTVNVQVDAEVTYNVMNDKNNRGLILHIGSENDCKQLMLVLEKSSTTKNNDDNQSTLYIDNQEEKPDSENEVPDDSENIPNGDAVSIYNVNSSKNSDKNNKRLFSTVDETFNDSDERLTSSKRSRVDDDSDEYLRGRLLLLKEENRKLKKKIQEMETCWMPRPDITTINYFSKIVSLCTNPDEDYEDRKADKLDHIMKTLQLTEAELKGCLDNKSIRSTCRKLVRVVFQTEISNPDIHFGEILKQKVKISAIRDYGRLMHPVDSLKFTDGELNNALGSDFYQRDRTLKQKSAEINITVNDSVNIIKDSHR